VNRTGLSRDMEEGLSDRKLIGELEELELEMVEPRSFANQIHKVIKSTCCLVNNHHYAALLDGNRT
jgi:hypothetical protein